MPPIVDPPLTAAAVLDALRGVIDPELGDNVVDLGMIRDVDVGDDGGVVVHATLTTAACPLRAQLRDDITQRVGTVPGVAGVEVAFAEMTAEQRRDLMARARWKARDRDAVVTDIPPTARVVAVGSGKGGVGKSSVTANLAVALAARGLTVGVLDADIGGFSIPRMLGVAGRITGEKGPDGRARFVPLERAAGAGRLKVVSMGHLEGSAEDEAIMWRGLMLNRAVQHFLEDVQWGDLDYLLIDMPPGTSDVQMGLARMLPRTEMLIVTTPAVAAQKVAARAADMARRGYLRVAGVIENMSVFQCDHGEAYALFGSGGGERLAAAIGAPLLGTIPIDPAVAAGGDGGRPAALEEGTPIARAFAGLAERVVADALPLVEMTGCTARVLEAVEQALGPTER